MHGFMEALLKHWTHICVNEDDLEPFWCLWREGPFSGYWSDCIHSRVEVSLLLSVTYKIGLFIVMTHLKFSPLPLFWQSSTPVFNNLGCKSSIKSHCSIVMAAPKRYSCSFLLGKILCILLRLVVVAVCCCLANSVKILSNWLIVMEQYFYIKILLSLASKY